MNAERLLDQIERAMDADDLEKAEALAGRLVQQAPELVEGHLALAHCAAGRGDTQAARRHAANALEVAEDEGEVVEAILVKAGIELSEDLEREARATMADLPPPEVGPADLEQALDAADLRLAIGDLDGARRGFERVTKAAPDNSDAWYGLGLCAERAGDEDGKRTAWVRALETDDAALPPEEHLEEDEFVEVAEAALAELPPRARELLRDVPIVVAERPSPGDVADGLDPRLLGMFVGPPHGEGHAMGATPQITQILLFRDNLERATFDPDELREEIRVTLLHEVGHFLGMSEDDLAERGLD